MRSCLAFAALILAAWAWARARYRRIRHTHDLHERKRQLLQTTLGRDVAALTASFLGQEFQLRKITTRDCPGLECKVRLATLPDGTVLVGGNGFMRFHDWVELSSLKRLNELKFPCLSIDNEVLCHGFLSSSSFRDDLLDIDITPLDALNLRLDYSCVINTKSAAVFNRQGLWLLHKTEPVRKLWHGFVLAASTRVVSRRGAVFFNHKNALLQVDIETGECRERVLPVSARMIDFALLEDLAIVMTSSELYIMEMEGRCYLFSSLLFAQFRSVSATQSGEVFVLRSDSRIETWK